MLNNNVILQGPGNISFLPEGGKQVWQVSLKIHVQSKLQLFISKTIAKNMLYYPIKKKNTVKLRKLNDGKVIELSTQAMIV